jgi:hypothetical protein
MLMARHVLGGPRDAGRASYQVALSVCPECHRGKQQAGGELVPVDAGTMEMADCDAQHVDLLRAAEVTCHAAAETPSESENESAHTGVATEAAPTRRSAHTVARAKQTIPPATR